MATASANDAGQPGSGSGEQSQSQQQIDQQQHDHSQDQTEQTQTTSQQQTIIEEQDGMLSQKEIELEEERKLKARHPCIQRPGSQFLQKRLQRGQKYFDSGDYNMAKASNNPNVKL